jgi:type VI secretion system ImpM family protein
MRPFEASALGVLGKAPHDPEFLRFHVGEHALALFDAWLAEGFEWALRHGGPAWPEAFTQAPVHAFAFRPTHGEPRFACGVLGPSADNGGRRFPLAVAASTRLADALGGTPEILPLILEDLWSAAGRVFAEVLGGRLEHLTGADGQAPPAPRLDLEEARALYASWARELRQDELWQLLGVPPADAARRLGELARALAPFVSSEPPETRLCLRLPLGRAGGVGLCFWLDVVRRALRWRETTPSFFWSHDGELGSALLLLGRPPRAAVAELFVPSGACDEVCDLTVELPGDAAPKTPVGEAFGDALADASASVERLLASLSGEG